MKSSDQNKKIPGFLSETAEMIFSRKGISVIRTILLLTAVILLNIAVYRSSVHIDLTQNKIYSLSEASRQTVAELEEPLTVRVFLSDNLPPPHNTLWQDLSDILEIFSQKGNRFFNYSIYTIPMDGSGDPEIEKMAEAYGINPVQIQDISRNEQTLKAAYLGMAVVYGDMVQVIPVINAGENLELLLTRTISGLTKKSSRFLSLDGKVSVDLLFSSSLYTAGQGVAGYPKDIEKAVNDLNVRDYGIFEYSAFDPEKEDISEFESRLGIDPIDFNGESVFATLVIRYGDKTETVPLLQNTGVDWQLLPSNYLSEEIERKTMKLIGAESEVGYLVGHNNPMLRTPYGYGGQQQVPALNFFSQTIEQSSPLKELDVRYSTIPEGVSTVIIAGPETPFSDWELYQIDQFLMRGNSLAVFYDPVREILPERERMMIGAQPTYDKNPSGLDKLLEHYGLTAEPSYLFDKSCFEQTTPDNSGGYTQNTFYFAPQIKKPAIDNNIAWLRGISDIVLVQASPLKVIDGLNTNDRLKILFSSSEEAWTVSEDITLDPAMIYPPSDDKLSQYPLAAILEGPFTSYFKGKEIPQRPVPPQPESGAGSQGLPGDPAQTGSAGYSEESGLSFAKESYEVLPFVESTPNGKPGKLFLMGTSKTLNDDMSHPQNWPANYLFNTGVIDALNGEEDFAVMRNKGQSFNPIFGGTPVIKQLIVLFCTMGIPFIVILWGFIVLLMRMSRRRKIAQMFTGSNERVSKGE